jgi:hypothetical protein
LAAKSIASTSPSSWPSGPRRRVAHANPPLPTLADSAPIDA